MSRSSQHQRTFSARAARLWNLFTSTIDVAGEESGTSLTVNETNAPKPAVHSWYHVMHHTITFQLVCSQYPKTPLPPNHTRPTHGHAAQTPGHCHIPGTMAVHVPVAHTEFVDRVVPTVVYQTEYQKLKETEFVTHVLTQLVTSTYTKSIVVPRKTYITQTYTSVVTRNILQRTTEVSYTPVVKTNQVTVTQTAVRVEQVPDIRYTTVERTRPVVSTAYVTETKLKLQPSVVFKTQYETRTQVSTQYVPRVSTVYGPPQTLTSTAYQHVTSSIYAPAPAGGGSGPVTITQQLKEYVPTVKTQYVTSTVVRKEYVTVTPKCPSGGGYGYSPPVQLGSYSEHEEQKVDLAGVAAPAAVAAPQVAAAAAAPLQQAVAVAFHQDSAGVSPASFGVPLPFNGAGAGGAGGAFPHVTQIVGKNYSLR
ncbi:uncharacterized protein LOC122258742 [Penaeus japonicus]|uniref:uncharacterized protein LOC122258742 n=1 Tax=Penaeus japonicus TaxID=27405 RepID=UPI001C714B4F|nr:uncharacterized protein LOC122258742 [Penaeus japonicus]